MIGQSDDIQKMVEHHNIMIDLNEAWRELEDKAQEFVSLVETGLPESSAHWARRVFSDMAPEEAVDELMSHLMFEDDRRPLSYAVTAALDAAHDEKTTITDLREGGLLPSLSSLMETEEAILDVREEYYDLIKDQEKVRRRGDFGLLTEIQRVRDEMANLEGGSPTRVDECQALMTVDSLARENNDHRCG